jgi:NAD(P)-dependent dehydrogenase (short-subunit alcohol dehydrogenase family)
MIENESSPWVLVAGGSGAIGGAICRALADDGWNVALTYRNNLEAAEKVAADVRGSGRSVTVTQLSLDVPDRVADVVQTCTPDAAPLGGVVYAAGPYFPLTYVSQMTADRFSTQIHQDTIGCFNLLRPSITRLRETRGSIVALSTSAVRRHLKGDLLSSAPKAAIEAIVKGIATEEGRYGLRANCVGVGVIDAGIWTKIVSNQRLGEDRIAAAKREIPLGRLGNPDDIAQGVQFLMSDRARWITGQTLEIDGGFSA